jgi:hypothetical protein
MNSSLDVLRADNAGPNRDRCDANGKSQDEGLWLPQIGGAASRQSGCQSTGGVPGVAHSSLQVCPH